MSSSDDEFPSLLDTSKNHTPKDSSSLSILDELGTKRLPSYRQEPKPEHVLSTEDDIYELDLDYSEAKLIEKRTREMALAKPKPKLQVDRVEKQVLRQQALPAVVEENARSEEEDVASEDERPRSKRAKLGPKPIKVVALSVEEPSEEEPSPSTSRQMDVVCSSSGLRALNASLKVGQTTHSLEPVPVEEPITSLSLTYQEPNPLPVEDLVPVINAADAAPIVVPPIVQRFRDWRENTERNENLARLFRAQEISDIIEKLDRLVEKRLRFFDVEGALSSVENSLRRDLLNRERFMIRCLEKDSKREVAKTPFGQLSKSAPMLRLFESRGIVVPSKVHTIFEF